MGVVKVLVTGSAGFLGTHAVKHLGARGLEVRGVDRVARRASDRLDVADPRAVERCVRTFRPDAILHLAALASVPGCEADPADCCRTNVLGTVGVVRAARARGARLVFASSAAVYGGRAPLPTPVDAPTEPTNLYGISKLAGEKIVAGLAPEEVRLRLFNVYGEGCRRSYVIPDLIRRLRTRPHLVRMQGTGREARDFVYVEDVMRAFELALRGRGSGAYNVGSGTRTPLRSLARTLARLTGTPDVVWRFRGPRAGDFRANHARLDGRNRLPGWNPRVRLSEGLARTIAGG